MDGYEITVHFDGTPELTLGELESALLRIPARTAELCDLLRILSSAQSWETYQTAMYIVGDSLPQFKGKLRVYTREQPDPESYGELIKAALAHLGLSGFATTTAYLERPRTPSSKHSKHRVNTSFT